MASVNPFENRRTQRASWNYKAHPTPTRNIQEAGSGFSKLALTQQMVARARATEEASATRKKRNTENLKLEPVL